MVTGAEKSRTILFSFSMTMLLTKLVTSLISLGTSHSFSLLVSGSSGTTGILTGLDTLGTREYCPKGQERMVDLRAATKSRPLVEFEAVSEDL